MQNVLNLITQKPQKIFKFSKFFNSPFNCLKTLKNVRKVSQTKVYNLRKFLSILVNYCQNFFLSELIHVIIKEKD